MTFPSLFMVPEMKLILSCNRPSILLHFIAIPQIAWVPHESVLKSNDFRLTFVLSDDLERWDGRVGWEGGDVCIHIAD